MSTNLLNPVILLGMYCKEMQYGYFVYCQDIKRQRYLLKGKNPKPKKTHPSSNSPKTTNTSEDGHDSLNK